MARSGSKSWTDVFRSEGTGLPRDGKLTWQTNDVLTEAISPGVSKAIFQATAQGVEFRSVVVYIRRNEECKNWRRTRNENARDNS